MPLLLNTKQNFLQPLVIVNATRMSESQSLRLLLSNCSLPANEARILLAHVLEKHYQLPRSALLSRDDMVLNEVAGTSFSTISSRDSNAERGSW